MYEGIVETDRWFGPLFTNLRFTRTNVPVRLRADFPLVQVQPLPRSAYADVTLGTADTTADLTGFGARDWADYGATIAIPNENPNRAFGGYAVSARKRQQKGCPFQAEAN
jgi:hypothetical protein